MTAVHARPAPRGAAGAADLMPPISLPGVHFAAGLAWLVAGAVGLVLVAPDLARGGLLRPHVVAVTHAFTLGWITTAIFGALYQLYPVTLGVAARSVRWGFGGFALLELGVAAVVGGAWWWRPPLLAVGWVLLLAAVGVVSWNLLSQRRRARRGRQIGLYVTVGHSALGFAMATVLVRIGAEAGWWSAGRLGWLGAHVHLAVVGFATLTVIGVGSKLFPMFLLSRDYSNRPLRWIAPVACAGLVLHAVGSIWALRVALLAGSATIAVAVAGWLAVVRGYYRTGTRARLEPGLAHAAAACGFLAVAVAAGLGLVVVPGTDARHLAAYGILGVLGWLSLLVVGMSYKILPFLTWLHRFSPRVGEEGVPKVADLTDVRLQWLTLALLGPGIAALAAAVAVGSPVPARWAAATVLAGMVLVAGQHAALPRAR